MSSVLDNVNMLNKNGHPPMHTAICSRNHCRVDQLIEQGADLHIVYRENQTLLHNACFFGLYSLVLHMLKAGVKQTPMEHNLYPIHYAIFHPEILEKLIEYGADVSVVAYSGRTALDMARDEKKLFDDYPEKTHYLEMSRRAGKSIAILEQHMT
jgi:ankyrin repeat protein